MRINETDERFTPTKKRVNVKTGPAVIIRDGKTTWSKNSFRRQPLKWNNPPKSKPTKAGRIQANTRIFVTNMDSMIKERAARRKKDLSD
jgi:outer membrane lipoprotein-sorting protein